MNLPSLRRSPGPFPDSLRALLAGRPRPTAHASARWRAVPALVVLVALTAACGGGPASGGPTGTGSQSGAPMTPGQAGSGEMTVVASGGRYTSVPPARLRDLLQAKDFVLVNVHVPYEGEIDGTDLFIPYDQVAARRSELPAAKDAKIFVYCRSGRMSSIAAATLVGLGYTNIWELDGGMIAWEASGLKLVQRPPS